jgi:hypothetical protein
MKNYLILSFILFFTLNASELSWVDTQIDAIKPPRKGMSSSEITGINSSFIYLKKEKEKKRSSYRGSRNGIKAKVAPKRLILSAIINNSALINGKWYRLNDKVRNYRLSNINRASIVLTNGKKKLVLTTNDISKNIKFK